MERFADLMRIGLYNCDCEWSHVTYEGEQRGEVEYEGTKGEAEYDFEYVETGKGKSSSPLESYLCI